MLLPRETFACAAADVAPALLGCVLEHDTPDGLVAVALTEVEAYHGQADPASHAYRGRTPRNAVMFGPPGHAYVYFTYGMHFCVNLVCLPEGTASAVLLRAGRVVAGEDLARARRTAPGPGGRDLARGPARLCQALAITRAQDGADVCDPASPLRVRWPTPAEAAAGNAVPAELAPASISRGPRVGVSAAGDVPWRFWVTGDPTVSVYRASGKRWDDTAVTDILDELFWRGLIAHHTDLDELRGAFTMGPVTLYGGFDPTAPGLHIGNLVLLLTMRRVQNAGHRPIGLVGGATGLIGDPSGKSAERVLNPRETVAAWVERIRREVERFLDFTPGPGGALVVSNLDWTADLTALDFLRDIGKHFPVNRMLARESVKARLETGGISYTEFSYQVLQANDFLELYRRHGCTLQIGGSDQWGNLVAGVDLIKRVEGASAHALATPLITKPDGTKYGKTEGDAVWLSPERTSAYRFYQFWINRSDAEVPGLLRVFTFRSAEEIAELERQTRDAPAARAGQRLLAEDVTTLVHGADECARVIAASRAMFGQGELRALDERALADALDEVGLVTVHAPGDGLPTVVDLLAKAGIADSKGDARRMIAAGGAYLNNARVSAEDAVLDSADLLCGRFLVLRRGRRMVAGVELVVG